MTESKYVPCAAARGVPWAAGVRWAAVAAICLGAAAPAAAETTLPVMDFCALGTAPKKDAKKYTKQKLILFSLAGIDKVEAGEVVVNDKGEKTGTRKVLAKVGGAKHFADVWSATFPMRRFYNVMVPGPAPADFDQRTTLSLADLDKAFAGPHQAFLRYSAACTDYVAVPHLTNFEATWSTQTKKKRVGKKTVTVTVHALSVKPTVAMAVFRREGKTFQLVERVEEGGGGLFDFATDLGAATMGMAAPGNAAVGEKSDALLKRYKAQAGLIDAKLRVLEAEAKKLRAVVGAATGSDVEPLSDAQVRLTWLRATIADLTEQLNLLDGLVKDPQGAADRLARAANPTWADLVSGLPSDAACAQKGAFTCGDGTFWLAERSVGVAGMSERSTPICKEADGQKMESVAPCEARVRAENIALLVQNRSQEIDGWRLFAPLRYAIEADDDDPQPAIELGAEEGVRRGAVFRAVEDVEGRREHVGFARVIHSGPGGATGAAEPSVLAWRGGDAPPGARMEEHPQIGVALSVGGGVSAGLDTSSDPFVEGLGALGGVGLDVGYNLSPYVDWGRSELWLRTNFDIGLGSISDAGAQSNVGQIDTLDWFMLNALAGPELKYYLFSRVDVFGSVLAGLSMASASTPDNKITREGEDEEENDSGGGATAAVRLTGGFDVLLHPDWQLRLAVGYRANLSEITLEPPDDIEPGQSAFDGQEVGTLSGVDAKAALTYIF